MAATRRGRGGLGARTAVVVVAVVVGIAAPPHPGATARAQGAASDPVTSRFLNGAIDIHLHIDPRTYGADISTLKMAKARGVRGVVVKNHYEPTVDVSLLLRREIPGLEIFGGTDLNFIVGGLNPAIIEHMGEALQGATGFRPLPPGAPRTALVWMPTFDSETAVRAAKQNRPFITVSRGGALVPEVKRIIALVAKHGLVLATGHNSSEEALLMLREGKAQGVRRMVVTHAMDNPIFMKVPQIKQAADLGAFIEFDYRLVLTHPEQIDAIRQVGPRHAILSEFLMPTGGADPLRYGHIDNMPKFVAGMRERGFTDRDLDLMLKENPARLLGLPPAP